MCCTSCAARSTAAPPAAPPTVLVEEPALVAPPAAPPAAPPPCSSKKPALVAPPAAPADTSGWGPLPPVARVADPRRGPPPVSVMTVVLTDPVITIVLTDSVITIANDARCELPVARIGPAARGDGDRRSRSGDQQQLTSEIASDDRADRGADTSMKPPTPLAAWPMPCPSRRVPRPRAACSSTSDRGCRSLRGFLRQLLEAAWFASRMVNQAQVIAS